MSSASGDDIPLTPCRLYAGADIVTRFAPKPPLYNFLPLDKGLDTPLPENFSPPRGPHS